MPCFGYIKEYAAWTDGVFQECALQPASTRLQKQRSFFNNFNNKKTTPHSGLKPRAQAQGLASWHPHAKVQSFEGVQ
jgi:hypothetical protein